MLFSVVTTQEILVLKSKCTKRFFELQRGFHFKKSGKLWQASTRINSKLNVGNFFIHGFFELLAGIFHRKLQQKPLSFLSNIQRVVFSGYPAIVVARESLVASSAILASKIGEHGTIIPSSNDPLITPNHQLLHYKFRRLKIAPPLIRSIR